MTRRIGFVGCGHIATVHSYAIAQLAKAGLVDAAITATFDTDRERAEKLAAHNHATAHDSIESLLDAVDVVWICTWTAGHLDAVRAAVQRGLAVFCEKPLAPNIEDCVLVAGLLERVPHQVGLVLRHAPVFAHVAEIVRTEEYGRVLYASLRDDQYFPIQGMYGSTWRRERGLAGGGTLIEHSIHDIDVLAWILGEARTVQATTAERFGHPGIEDTAVVQLQYDSGASATLASVWHQVLSRGSSRRLEVFCERAYLWTEDDYLGPLHVQTADDTTERTAALPDWAALLAVPDVYEKSVAQYAEPALAFLKGLDAPGGPRRGHPSATEALSAHRVVEAAYRSASEAGVKVTPSAL
ncbi:MAG TPA: Gfo/Idh/MocA family oxidoreductase [Acidimicrobiia bacterium]|jgi:predicted dehydrogenase